MQTQTTATPDFTAIDELGKIIGNGTMRAAAELVKRQHKGIGRDSATLDRLCAALRALSAANLDSLMDDLRDGQPLGDLWQREIMNTWCWDVARQAVEQVAG